MSNEQIAHDLAIAKLSGSTLPTDKLVEEYHKQYIEVMDYLSKHSTLPKRSQIVSSPM